MSTHPTTHQETHRITGRDIIGDTATRTRLARKLASHSAKITTASLKAIESRLPWFSLLGAQDRSWITLVAKQGIDGLVEWLADTSDELASPVHLFSVAPRAMTRKVSLLQTVDLVRTVIDVVDEQIKDIVPSHDRDALSTAVLTYSREVAFASAQVYATAAESRGNWDARMEALVVDAVVRDDPDASLVSRASTLGWKVTDAIRVIVGSTPPDPSVDVDLLREEATHCGLSILASIQGSKLIVILGGSCLNDDNDTVKTVTDLSCRFGDGPIVIGPVMPSLEGAHTSAKVSAAGLNAAPAWPEGPRILHAHQLLPERALAGDESAISHLCNVVYTSLADSGNDLLQTCITYFDQGSSVEATARELYVHSNTVRYRLKRIHDVTGYSPMNPREAYVLRLAISLGRLRRHDDAQR